MRQKTATESAMPISAEVSDQAAEWFLRISEDPITDDDVAAFQRWLTEDPAHETAYEQLAMTWADLGDCDFEPADDALDQDSPIHVMAPQPTMRPWMGMAAAVLVVLGLGGAMMTPLGLLADHRTAANERKTLTLADGSTVALNGETAISVTFNEGAREIELHGGEAYFTVTSDKNRPFTVTSPHGRVEVLGTAFNLRDNDEGLSVTVTESRVQVVGEKGDVVRLGPGQRAKTDGTTDLVVASVDPSRETSWMQGSLIFEDAPFAEVVARLDLLFPGRFVVLPPDLDDLTVTGVYATDDPERILETLELTLPLKFIGLGPVGTFVIGAEK